MNLFNPVQLLPDECFTYFQCLRFYAHCYMIISRMTVSILSPRIIILRGNYETLR